MSLMRAKISSACRSISSVSASTYQEPPSGSATFMTPVSSMITCWVRSAIWAAFALGSASTSSRALVCSDLVPPRTAASASTAVRTTLLSGCWAVSETPAVWVWKRSYWAFSVCRAVDVAQPAGPDPAGRAELGDLLEEVDVRVEEERQPGRELLDVQAAGQAQLDVGEAVGQRVGELLRGGRAGLADVVAGDRDRLVRRDVLGAVLHQVADQAQVRLGGEQPLLLRDVLLEDVGLQRAVEDAEVDALALGGDQVHAEHRDGGAADRHRRRGVAERDVVEQHVHVGGGVDRDAAVPDLAERPRVVGVAAHQGRHVEGDGEAAAALGQDHLVALVGLLGVAEAGELADGPGPAAVAGGVQAAGERELARPADPLEAGRPRTRRPARRPGRPRRRRAW